MLKKIILWAVLIVVVYFVATDPGAVVGYMHSVFSAAQSGAAAMSNFVHTL